MMVNGSRDAGTLVMDGAGQLQRKTPKIEAVYLDLDGVLANFVGGALRACNQPASRLKPGVWEIHTCLDYTIQEFWSRCQGHLFWSQLDALHDAEAIVSTVEAFCAVEDADLWLLSAPSDDAGSFSGKYEWVGRHFNRLKRKLVIACNKAAMHPRPGMLLVDDSDANVKAWQGGIGRVGGQAVLVPRWWNSGYRIAREDNMGTLPHFVQQLNLHRQAQ